MAHSLTSPSSSHRWLACSGSLQLLQQHPEPPATSEALVHGNRVHDLAKTLLTRGNVAQTVQDLSATLPQEDLPLLQEAVSFTDYIRHLHSVLSRPRMVVERLHSLASLHPDMYGTPDVLLYSQDQLHVIDLKTGATPVRAKDNPQLQLYAWAAILAYDLSPAAITLHIYQDNARAGHNTNTYTLTLPRLTAFIEAVKNTLSLIDQGFYKYTQGTHCEYCPVKTHCPIFFQQQCTQFAQAEELTATTLASMTPAQAAHIYTTLKALQPLMDRAHDVLITQTPETLHAHSLTLKTRTPPQKYTDPQAALTTLQHTHPDDATLLDQVAPRTLITPTQLKRKHPALYQTLTPHMDTPQPTHYLATLKPQAPSLPLDNTDNTG